MYLGVHWVDCKWCGLSGQAMPEFSRFKLDSDNYYGRMEGVWDIITDIFQAVQSMSLYQWHHNRHFLRLYRVYVTPQQTRDEPTSCIVWDTMTDIFQAVQSMSLHQCHQVRHFLNLFRVYVVASVLPMNQDHNRHFSGCTGYMWHHNTQSYMSHHNRHFLNELLRVYVLASVLPVKLGIHLQSNPLRCWKNNNRW
jgi:hypothetical protein